MAVGPANARIVFIDGTGGPSSKEMEMDRQTKREYFERICQLRDRHAQLGRADTTSVITIEAMIARASRLLDQPGLPLLTIDSVNPTKN